MEQGRIEHSPNGSLLTYIASADALVNDSQHGSVHLPVSSQYCRLYTCRSSVQDVFNIFHICKYFADIDVIDILKFPTILA